MTAYGPQVLPVPPDDDEKYGYLGRQHRWFFVAHLIAFIGIAYSLYGFSRMTYWTLIFLIPLGFYATETILGTYTSTFRRRVSLHDHQQVVEFWSPDKYPSVDIYLPTCGEGMEILENTYRHVEQIRYPGRWTVYVLDDKNRNEVAHLAREYGFEYIARPGREFKKAGNLQYAFGRTDGEHILILDADFVPRRDMLTEIVPYMDDDPRIGLIQTPQFYASHRKGLGWLERCAAATQETFYRFIQPSRDAVEATICCGTSALYRRAALEKSNGFPQISHSEDVFTGFNLIEHGYRAAFVPIVLSQGLCPNGIDPYISQQYRWCEGSMELLRMRAFHYHPAISVRQRAAYWSGFFYYITTAFNAFFAPIPLLIMIFLFPQYVRPQNFLPLLGLPLLWLVAYPVLMKTKWRIETLRVQLIYGFTHAVAVYDMFFGEEAEWIPSGGIHKATPLAKKVKTIIAGWLTATVGAVIIGMIYRLSEARYSLTGWWVLILFWVINLYVFLPVMWQCWSSLFTDWRSERIATTQKQKVSA